jgi:hypothetical protein
MRVISQSLDPLARMRTRSDRKGKSGTIGLKALLGCGTGEAAAFHDLREDRHVVEAVHSALPTIAQYRIVYSIYKILSNMLAESTLTRLRNGLKGVICSLFLNL